MGVNALGTNQGTLPSAEHRLTLTCEGLEGTWPLTLSGQDSEHGTFHSARENPHPETEKSQKSVDSVENAGCEQADAVDNRSWHVVERSGVLLDSAALAGTPRQL